MKNFGPFYVIIAATLWGIDGILLRPGLYTLPVSLVVFIESTIIVLVLSPFYIKSFKDMAHLKTHDYLAFAGVAIMGGAIGTMAITKALFYVNFVNLSIVVLIQKLQPVFAILLASIFLKERPPRIFYFWAALAVVGAYVMAFGFTLPGMSAGGKTLEASFFAILATIGFASSTVLSKRALKNISFHLATYLRFLFSASIMFIIVLSLGDLHAVSQVSRSQWGVFLAITLVTGAPGIFLYYYGLKHIKASVATIAELAFPLTAILLEFWVHNNILNIYQWLGVAILFFSMLKVTRLKSFYTN